MEKISQIVRPNARMTSADLPKAGSVRPGAPGFGRQTGESRGGPVKEVTTAERAGLAASDLAEQRRAGESKIIDQMARDFFMSEAVGPAAQPASGASIGPVALDLSPPASGYVPRGSLIDVQA